MAAYACVTSNDCYFYATADLDDGVFLLPETYFVKILDETQTCYQIEYLSDGQNTRKVTGYCLKDKVDPVDYLPVTPYLYHFFDVTYTIGEENADGFLTQITVNCVYYGDYTVGTKTYCYVLRGEEFGYVPKPVGFSYPANPEYAERNAQNTPSETDEGSSLSPAFFIALALLAPAAAFLIFRFSSKKNAETERSD